MNLIPLFSYGILGLLIASILLLVLFLMRFLQPSNKTIQKFSKLVSKHAIVIAFITVSLGTVGSLYLSEVASFTPCELCWYQRIFMYPQVVILGIGYFINDVKVKVYAIALSIIGFMIAVYHILVQFLPTMFQCSDEVANCALTQFVYFGFITIPVMSAITFGFIIIVLLFTFLRNSR